MPHTIFVIMVNIHISLTMSYDCTKARQIENETLALRALAWIVGDPDQGQRFLDLTGLDVATLRAQAGSIALLSAALAYLEAHEPSLRACAAALDIPPTDLVQAHLWLKRHDAPASDL